MHKIYVLERIKDGGGYRAGEIMHAHAPCKGWRVLRSCWDGHGGGGLR